MYHVIIVDDEKYVRKSIRAKIDWESLGCEVTGEAKDGMEALELLKSSHVDIMLIDIMMPKLGGLDLIAQIRDKYPNLQIAIISGHDDFIYARQAMRLQVVDFIKKPINEDELAQTVGIMTERIETMTRKSEELSAITNKVIKFNTEIHLKEINSICENPEASVSIFAENAGQRYGWLLLYFTPLSPARKKIENEQWEDIRDYLKKIITEEFGGLKYYISFNELLMNEIRLLIPENEKILSEICGYIFPRLMIRYKNIFSAMHAASIDRYEPADGLHMLYGETLDLLKEKIFYKDSCVLKEDMRIESDGKKAEVIFSMLEHLKELIKARQFIKVESTLKKLLSITSYLCISSLESIVLGIHSLAMEYSALYDIKMSDFSSYQLTGKYTILTYSGLEQLYNTLESFIFSFFFEATQFSDDHVVLQVQKYIDNNLSEKIGTSQIAKIFFFNPSYLSQLFKKHTKMTLTKYIEKQRIEKACKLLLSFDLSITEIAGEVGYNDANYFSKVFGKRMGFTPTEYKENLKKY